MGAAPLCLFQEISKEINKIVFEYVVFSYERLKSSFYKYLYNWACVYSGITLVTCIF